MLIWYLAKSWTCIPVTIVLVSFLLKNQAYGLKQNSSKFVLKLSTIARNMSVIKQALLTIVATVTIFLFFKLNVYEVWFNSIIEDEKMISVALNQLDLEIRKNAWLGESYMVSANILNYFKQHQFDEKKALVLFPPHGYLIEKRMDFAIPEPAKFYYFTGIKSTWINSPMAEEANYVIAVHNKAMIIVPVSKDSSLNFYLAEFRKYPVTL